MTTEIKDRPAWEYQLEDILHRNRQSRPGRALLAELQAFILFEKYQSKVAGINAMSDALQKELRDIGFPSKILT